MASHRIYIVQFNESKAALAQIPSAIVAPPRLIRAGSAAQAIRHAARHYEAKVASQDDIAKQIKAGIEIEEASDQPACE